MLAYKEKLVSGEVAAMRRQGDGYRTRILEPGRGICIALGRSE
jgi:hypothetical protein